MHKGVVTTFHPNYIFPMVFHGAPRATLKGYSVSVGNRRLRMFKDNPKCVVCGLEGTLFQLEFNGNPNPHLNFYGFGPSGMILMTQDHIHPRARGGRNTPSNLQTMCAKCNSRKGSLLFEEFLERLKPCKDG